MAGKPGVSLTPLEEVQAAVMGLVQPVGTEQIALGRALGRILGEDVVAVEAVPPFANSAMDGFAVRSSDVGTEGARLDIVDDLPAGASPSVPVGPGQAVRIMTGAPVPDGADAVVRVEDTITEGSTVAIKVSVSPGTSVRPAGGDVKSGSVVFDAGTRLSAMHVGVLATLGVHSPVVTARPRVAFMSTGDELSPVDSGPLRPGMIRDSNRPMLRSLLAGIPVEPVDLGAVPDDETALKAALDEASGCDAVISTGGVSMGDYDVTKLLLEGEADIEFVKVAIQPAKPFAYGRLGSAVFFGMPGNPVSALVSFEQLVRPALLKMAGSKALYRPLIPVVTTEDVETDPEKTVFVRVRIVGEVDGRLSVALSGGQSSNVLSAAANADGLAVVPRGVGDVSAGEVLMLQLINSPESVEVAN